MDADPGTNAGTPHRRARRGGRRWLYWLVPHALLLCVGVGLFAARPARPAGRPDPPADIPLAPEAGPLAALADRLRPLAKALAEPGPSDWLANHRERGQTFAQYVASEPVTARGERRVLHVQPLGDFTPTQRRIVTLVAEYLGLAYGLPVAVDPDLPVSLVPERARRRAWGTDQLLTGYILREVLRPRLPADAVAVLGLTASDLWPGSGWNFVFGQASLADRVGVWSVHRVGDPDESDEAFRLALVRAAKTAVHETGHMLSIQHCTAHECVMCGSNHLEESDRRPLEFCPECVAKVWWATGVEPIRRAERVLAFCRSQGLDAEGESLAQAVEALRRG
ncbi:MAG: archaemetzincin [Planctomycetales bacterium]|nr:archaemetzincin [Planctomycetales bacterium]